MSIITFILVLGVLVATHELGHFLAAKFFGVKVEEFALGFPPKLWGKQIGETKYLINLIPFGGYVKVYGEDDDAHINQENKNRALVNQPKWVQAIVLCAGVFGNVLLAWVLFSLAFTLGFPLSGEALQGYKNVSERTIVTSIVPNSAASQSNLAIGDQILEVTVGDKKFLPKSVEDLRTLVKDSQGQPLNFKINHDNKIVTTSITPEGSSEKGYLLGLALAGVGIVKLPIHLAVVEGARVTVMTVKETFAGFGYLINELIEGRSVKDAVAGPVGIANLVGEAGELGLVYLLSFVAFISINLAVLNILPIPALDGGRLLFLLIEKIKGSPLNRNWTTRINLVSFLALISLMLVITGLDIWRLIK